MAFDINNFSRTSVALNTGQVTLADSSNINGPALFTYQTGDDTAAQIAAANYFDPAASLYALAVGDFIFANGSDATTVLKVDAIDRDAGTVSTVSTGLTGSVDTANIANDAVTTAKIDDDAVTSAKVDPQLIQFVQVDVSLAEFIGSYTTSHLLLAAPGVATQKIILHRATLWIDYGGTVLADGGAVRIQYGNTANAGGTAASTTVSDTDLIAATADTSFGFSPVDTTLTDSTTLNEGLYLATATADFTGGTSSAYKVGIWYSIQDFA